MIEEYKFYISRAHLMEYLRLSQLVIDKKIDLAAPKITFLLKQNLIDIYCSDASMSFKASMVINNQIEGSFALSLNILYHLIRKLDDDLIQFIIEPNHVNIQYDSGYANLIKLTPDSFPARLEEPISSFRYIGSDLSDKIRSIKSTIANEDIRKQFTGMICIGSKDDITIWSTDGHKLSLNTIDVAPEKEFKNIWPRKFIECICSVSSNSMSYIKIYERSILYQIDNIEIITQLINDVQVINYKDIIKDGMKESIKINIEVVEFIKKLERIMIMADESSRVYLLIDEKCSIGCNNAKDGASHEFLNKITHEGQSNLKIYFNGSYLLTFLKNFKESVNLYYYQTTNTIILSKGVRPIYMTKAMKEKKSEH